MEAADRAGLKSIKKLKTAVAEIGHRGHSDLI